MHGHLNAKLLFIKHLQPTVMTACQLGSTPLDAGIVGCRYTFFKHVVTLAENWQFLDCVTC